MKNNYKKNWIIPGLSLLILILGIVWLGYANDRRSLALILPALCLLTASFLKLTLYAGELESENKKLCDDLQQKEAVKQELLKKQMDLALLQNQINPHFLYNTLEAIRSEAELTDQEEIAVTTERLAKYFRYCISRQDDAVHFFEEIQNIQDYFYIIQFRFFDRIRLEIHIEDEQIMQCYIPRMTLQPLVENAINHGLKDKVRDGVVAINASRSDRIIYLTVSDNGCGMTDEQQEELEKRLRKPPEISAGRGRHNGIALYNVHHRLQLIFGEEYGVHIKSVYGCGTDICMEIPADYIYR